MKLKYKIIDNFLHKEDFITLKNSIINKEFSWYFQDLINGNHAKNDYMVDNSIEYLQEMSGSFNKESPCWAGYHSLYVDCFGNIFPCFYYMEKNMIVKNIKNISIKELWGSKEYHSFRKKLLSCKECFFVCQMELNALFNKFNFLTKRKK